MKQKKTLSEWLTHNYSLVVRDYENFETKFSLRLNFAKVITIGFLTLVMVIVLSIFVANSLRKNTVSSTSTLDRQIVSLSEQVDSLEQIIETSTKYYQNLHNVLTHNVKTEEGEAQNKKEASDTNDNASLNESEVQAIDSAFRKQFENAEQSWGFGGSSQTTDLKKMLFFPPVHGMVLKSINTKTEHYGVDIVASKNESIKAIADGTVIMASWTQDTGHIIAIQHQNELVSFYKHNSVLLKKVGDVVTSGTPIAIIGNSGELTDGPHLHFELWHQGYPLNPENYISF